MSLLPVKKCTLFTFGDTIEFKKLIHQAQQAKKGIRRNIFCYWYSCKLSTGEWIWFQSVWLRYPLQCSWGDDVYMAITDTSCT
jgi:hypothetical protein